MSGEDSAYAALGLRPGAGRAEVEQAYRRLIKRYHPDMKGGDPGRAAEINRAYTQLRRAGAAPPLRPRRNVPVPVYSRTPPKGRRAGLLLIAAVSGVAAFGLANETSPRGPGRSAYTLPFDAPGPLLGPASSISASPLANFEEPVDTAVIDRAIADALRFHADGDFAATAEYSRACHDRFRREPSLTWFDSCTAFDEAIVALGGSPLVESGRFDASSVTARQMGAARLLSHDSLAADSRLRQIRSQVELALVPELDEAAGYRP